MERQRIDFAVAGGIARIVLANPENRNAIDGGFCEAFAAIAAACENDRDIALILLAARGDFFSVGGDFRDFVANRSRIAAHLRGMATLFHDGIMSLRRAAAPVLAAVNGTAAGGGFSLVCAADLVLARRSAKFVSAYTRSGLTPDGGLTFFLPRIVGLRAAFDIMATNPTLTAEQAQALGIVSRVVDDDGFEAEVERTLQELAALPAGTLAGLKSLLRSSTHADLVTQLAAEREAIARSAASPATQERLDAFLARTR
jgi:2-(1,2-epoxy-1,2-dihydrophenyl)acetyl-CoA isomerase